MRLPKREQFLRGVPAGDEDVAGGVSEDGDAEGGTGLKDDFVSFFESYPFRLSISCFDY